ncbi:amidohydrolase family protein [Sporichthya sp.]|uniref:amidohydrolase family protein n=1 Tax=Sporichthya sp. TaxID=65475 RepID=UPI0017BFD94F|nr:amidohydrolase family protein [Sporichthya sp.]MBA3741551.1 amidohydrolase [Sporichthya sp.]
MPDLGYAAFDADNHYYEAHDAFTRHLDPRLGPRTIEWVEVAGGRRYHAVGGQIARVVSNPTFDPVAKPGSLAEYFRGNPRGKKPEELLADRHPIQPEYLDRDARLKTMDAQGLEAVWLFPTLAVLYEELLRHDPMAVAATFTAFNRWADEDWGCNYKDRIFTAPYLSLADLDTAIGELEWALGRGARVVCMRPAAPTTAVGQISPGDPSFDPFWARLNEAGIPLVFHASDSGYSTNGYANQRFSGNASFGDGRPTVKMFALERAVGDMLATLIFDKVFDRFPNLRIASVENGAQFVPDLLRKMHSTATKMPGYFSEDPVETFKRHVWINPFWEDDVTAIAEIMGPDHVIFGSDWPHMEGLAEPLDYAEELTSFDAETRRKIMRGNAEALNTPRLKP